MPRKAKINRAEVLAAALRLADREGLAALSMRKLGESLGVEAMSLYNHVPNKASVLDGIHEAVLSEMPALATTGDWKADAKALACAFWEVLIRHPNVLVLFATRPAIARGSLDYVERGLSVLAAPFPEMRERIYAFQSLVTFVVGHAMSSAAEPVEDLDYSTLPADDYPNLSASVSVLGALSARDEMVFGLDALLDGMARRGRDSNPR